jgi:hypothetical protein
MLNNWQTLSLIPTRTNTDSSCSVLCRASTSRNVNQIKEVHGRDNLHAAAGRSRMTLFGIMACKIQSRLWVQVCENVRAQRMRRIVFSLVPPSTVLPVLFFSYSTQSRQNFYVQVRRRSFPTAWVKTGKAPYEHMFSALPPKSGHCAIEPACPFGAREQTSYQLLDSI